MLDNVKVMKWLGRFSFIVTAFLFTFSFPCYQFAEFAYFFAVPFLLWGYLCKDNRALWWTAFGSGWLGWLLTVMWLRHIWIGLPFAATAYGALYLGGWLFVASLTLKKVMSKGAITRVVALLGLAGFWVVLEWIRGWLFTGCLWLPLAASQWELPSLLQILSWTGAYGLSFVLIFFNLAITSFFIGLIKRANSKTPKTRRVEVYLGVALLLGPLFLFLNNLPQEENREFAFNAGFVQPDVVPQLKWDKDFYLENLRVLKEETFKVAAKNPDVIIWPETAVPSPLNNGGPMDEWVANVVNEADVPFLIGALGKEGDGWYNGIFEVRPQLGVVEEFYAKQKRVPFGEYVPLRGWIPFVNKVVPVDFDLTPGTKTDPLLVEIAGKEWKVGGLVCYEDIFSGLARKSVLAGNDFFLVITNDGWYSSEGGAYQHAAHSVLRAAEFRRPILRCGNNGWSGWIDEYGIIRNVALGKGGTVYFRGGSVFPIYRDTSWVGKLTFYAKYGDWFVAFSGLLMFFGFVALRKSLKRDEV